jgi:L-seryl-tRNA(Ser) seleniumtransferase
MVTASRDSVQARADRIATRLRQAGVACDVVSSEAAVGGGAFPTAKLESAAIAINGKADAIERKLRTSTGAIIGRIENERMLLDLRSILPDQDESLAKAILNALEE